MECAHNDFRLAARIVYSKTNRLIGPIDEYWSPILSIVPQSGIVETSCPRGYPKVKESECGEAPPEADSSHARELVIDNDPNIPCILIHKFRNANRILIASFDEKLTSRQTNHVGQLRMTLFSEFKLSLLLLLLLHGKSGDYLAWLLVRKLTLNFVYIEAGNDKFFSNDLLSLNVLSFELYTLCSFLIIWISVFPYWNIGNRI